MQVENREDMLSDAIKFMDIIKTIAQLSLDLQYTDNILSINPRAFASKIANEPGFIYDLYDKKHPLSKTLDSTKQYLNETV